MGRSVSYLSHAEHKIFFQYESEYEEDWRDLIYTIKESINEVAPSLTSPSRDRWDGGDTQIILANDHAEIGISEYCGLVSLSIRVNETDQYYTGPNSLSLRWIRQMWQPMIITMMKNGMTFYNKNGSFSNGEGAYGKINAEQYEYDYLKEKLMGKHSFVIMPKKMNKNWKRFNDLGLKIHSDLKR